MIAPADIRKLKEAMKQAVAESLSENREVFREMVADIVEEMALAEAIKQGRKGKLVSTKKVLDALKA